MTKRAGQYVQYQPALFISDCAVPTIALGSAFVYLGKSFDFAMNNDTIKLAVLNRLRELLSITTSLKVKPQRKLNILKLYIRSQLNFDLGTYDISLTWIKEQLDSQVNNSVRIWLELPISTCVAEILSLPLSKGGFGIPSLKSTAESLRLGQRFRLKTSQNAGMNDLWAETTLQNVVIDSFINANPTNCASATAALKNTRKNEDLTHVQSLVLQGAMITAVSESAIGKGAIKRWSAQISKLPAPLFKFVRKAIVQQLATSTNLVRWGKTHNPLCPLCLKPQTNKHVLSNCSAMISLERYKTRHDRILKIIADWIADSLKPGQTLHADLNSSQYKSVRDVFQTLRPDIAIVGQTV